MKAPKPKTYRNVSKQPQTVVGVGTVKPGATLKSDTRIINANFKEVVENKSARQK